jgi:hypothetical protein
VTDRYDQAPAWLIPAAFIFPCYSFFWNPVLLWTARRIKNFTQGTAGITRLSGWRELK